MHSRTTTWQWCHYYVTCTPGLWAYIINEALDGSNPSINLWEEPESTTAEDNKKVVLKLDRRTKSIKGVTVLCYFWPPPPPLPSTLATSNTFSFDSGKCALCLYARGVSQSWSCSCGSQGPVSHPSCPRLSPWYVCVCRFGLRFSPSGFYQPFSTSARGPFLPIRQIIVSLSAVDSWPLQI